MDTQKIMEPAGDTNLQESRWRLGNCVSSEMVLRLAYVVEQIAESVIITDTEGIIQYVNPAYTAISGYSQDELIGRDIAELRSERRDEHFYAEMWEQLRAGKVWHGRFTNQRKNGEVYQADATITPFRDENGVITSFVSVKRDISDQIKTEKQLHQANKLESIGQLAAGIAHEINTPAQYVGDNLRFIRESFREIVPLLVKLYEYFTTETEQPEAGDLLADLKEALDLDEIEYLIGELPMTTEQSIEGIERITSIVSAMKAFSHPSDQQKTPTDLNESIKTTIVVSRNEWKYYAELETQLCETLPMALCYPDEINQVILNMIVNAAHAIAGRNGETGVMGKIRIATRHDAEWVYIDISDTGVGIPAKVRDRIFDPFFTTKAVGKGTGQGLSLAYGTITDKHQGKITFQTTTMDEDMENCGTTFTIALPLKKAE